MLQGLPDLASLHAGLNWVSLLERKQKMGKADYALLNLFSIVGAETETKKGSILVELL